MSLGWQLKYYRDLDSKNKEYNNRISRDGKDTIAVFTQTLPSSLSCTAFAIGRVVINKGVCSIRQRMSLSHRTVNRNELFT